MTQVRTQKIDGAPTPEEIKEKINARLTALRERRSEVQHELLAIEAEITQLEAAREAVERAQAASEAQAPGRCRE